LFSRERDECAFTEIELAREGQGTHVRDARSGRSDMRLVKLTGSSFERFVRDGFTTLPETVDRPLFVHLDVGWRYGDLADATGDRSDRYVDPLDVRDEVRRTFDETVSRSIQHLVHEIGRRILARWPGLSEVSFEAQNRTWDAVLASDRDPTRKVHTDPRATFGRIGLVLRR
ncbi:MAG TPA: uricase, partial [Candidatus Limnocylindria bacterium]|nr:uricase [Candidatus Limnocylindria bacterium]